jgi:hypothetical protein
MNQAAPVARRTAYSRLLRTTKTVTQQPEQRNHQERRRRDALDSLIREQIIHGLGEPRDLLKVQVRPLWNNYYRANVFTGTDAVSAQITDSYFLTADDDGAIIASTPEIARKY